MHDHAWIIITFADTLLHLHVIQDALPVYLHCSEATRQLSLPYFNADSVTLSLPSPCNPSLGPLQLPHYASEQNYTQVLDVLVLKWKKKTQKKKPTPKKPLLVPEPSVSVQRNKVGLSEEPLS